MSDDAKTLADVISRLPAYSGAELGDIILYHLDDETRFHQNAKVLLINEKHRAMIVKALTANPRDDLIALADRLRELVFRQGQIDWDALIKIEIDLRLAALAFEQKEAGK